MTEQPTIPSAELARPILPFVKIQAIELMTTTAVREPEVDRRGGIDTPLHASHEIHATYLEETRQAIAVVKLEVEGKDDNASLAKWTAIYRLVYIVDAGYDGDLVTERSKAFCQTYSVAHVWPYWRELLASLCNRMGLPTILAPIITVGANLGSSSDEKLEETNQE